MGSAEHDEATDSTPDTHPLRDVAWGASFAYFAASFAPMMTGDETWVAWLAVCCAAYASRTTRARAPVTQALASWGTLVVLALGALLGLWEETSRWPRVQTEPWECGTPFVGLFACALAAPAVLAAAGGWIATRLGVVAGRLGWSLPHIGATVAVSTGLFALAAVGISSLAPVRAEAPEWRFPEPDEVVLDLEPMVCTRLAPDTPSGFLTTRAARAADARTRIPCGSRVEFTNVDGYRLVRQPGESEPSAWFAYRLATGEPVVLGPFDTPGRLRAPGWTAPACVLLCLFGAMHLVRAWIAARHAKRILRAMIGEAHSDGTISVGGIHARARIAPPVGPVLVLTLPRQTTATYRKTATEHFVDVLPGAREPALAAANERVRAHLAAATAIVLCGALPVVFALAIGAPVPLP